MGIYLQKNSKSKWLPDVLAKDVPLVREESPEKRRVSKKRRVSRKRVVRKRRKARKVSIRGTRAQVFRGTRQKVKTTGQTKKDLMKSKSGKIVSKKANAAGKRAWKRNGLNKWSSAFTQARKNLKITGFLACKKGSKLYNETMRLYKK